MNRYMSWKRSGTWLRTRLVHHQVLSRRFRITFPDDEDVAGKRHSGRVVVLRIGQSGAEGMEPVEQEQLPAYQSSDSGKFHSLDLDRIGGIERERAQTPVVVITLRSR